jgi:hypothetical protein
MNKLIMLTPLEPYFFGGETIFEIGAKDPPYFTRSLETPSQTALLGVMRYLGIRHKRQDYSIDDATKQIIGDRSFDLLSDGQTFGSINSISPLYLIDMNGQFLIPVPMDHRKNNENGNNNTLYTPWESYSEPFITNGNGDDSRRVVPLDFKAKDGIASGWLRVSDRSVIPSRELFSSDLRTVIDKEKRESAFAKREYKRLKKGYAFAFFANVSDGFPFAGDIVYMGQKSSGFRVSVRDESEEDLLQQIRQLLTDTHDSITAGRFVYAQSDVFVGEGQDVADKLYRHCSFVCAQTKNHRVFMTNTQTTSQKERFERGSAQIKLIRAGSCFLARDEACKDEFLIAVQDKHAEIAGFNKVL